MSKSWTVDVLANAERQLLSKGSAWKPAVWRVQASGFPLAVWKDGSHLTGLPRWVAALQLRREKKCLENLAGLEGFPQLLAVDCELGFLAEFMPGRELDRDQFQQNPVAFAAALRTRVQSMHARGVFHWDLKQRRNILVDSVAGLQFLDFGAGWAPGPLNRRLLGSFLAFPDQQAVLKWLARWAPEQLSVPDAKTLRLGLRLRRLWPFTPHRDRGELAAIAHCLGSGAESRDSSVGSK